MVAVSSSMSTGLFSMRVAESRRNHRCVAREYNRRYVVAEAHADSVDGVRTAFDGPEVKVAHHYIGRLLEAGEYLIEFLE